MTARRFRLEIAGQVVFGLAFESEAALEEFLAARGVTLADALAVSQIETDIEPRPTGRPSFHSAIAAAVRSLGKQLDPRSTLSERARLIQTHIAQSCTDPAAIPATRTIRKYFASRPVGRNVGRNPGRKSTRARIARAGGG